MKEKTVKPDALKEYLSFLQKEVGIEADKFILPKEEPAVYVDSGAKVKVDSIPDLQIEVDFLIEDGVFKELYRIEPYPYSFPSDLGKKWKSKWEKYVQNRKQIKRRSHGSERS